MIFCVRTWRDALIITVLARTYFTENFLSKFPENVEVFWRPAFTPGEGGTHILRHTGMCRNFGAFFWEKSLNMGPIFHEKIPNYGSDFQNFPGFAENFEKIAKNGSLFSEKSLNMGTFFEKNYPWTWVWVPSCQRHIPPTTPNLRTPPRGFHSPSSFSLRCIISTIINVIANRLEFCSSS